MNHYPRHLGDYAKDTRHLSMLEHGAYTLLLDYYYATEKPIPEDRCERIANAHANAERSAVRSVLDQFFTLTEYGWTHHKVETVLAEIRTKSEKAAASAKLRWNKETPDANALRTHSEGNASASIASHKPLTKAKEKDQAKAAALPPWLPEKSWTDFVEHRKVIKKPMSPQAVERMLEKLSDFNARGIDLTAAIDNSIRSNWQDIFEPRAQFAAAPAPVKRRLSELKAPASLAAAREAREAKERGSP